MRRIAIVACALLPLAVPAPAPAANTHESWAQSAIGAVTRSGIFPGTPATFNPGAPLEAGALARAVTRLGGADRPPADPSTPVSIAGLDKTLVAALGLEREARAFYLGARRVGLHPPGRFGTEVVARLLGLRTDLPVRDDAFELRPAQTATRADAAFSAARVLTLAHGDPGPGRPSGSDVPATPLGLAGSSLDVQSIQALASTFALPTLIEWQGRVIQTAVSLIGYPYVWGGDDEKTALGFDCSGLVWRVFKLASYPGGESLQAVFQGRTASDMAFEVPKRDHIGRKELEPADVLFFGAGRRSTPAEVDHAAIYLGNDWMIESSGQGVALARLDWNWRGFAWARRPLAEAGLEPASSPTS